MFLVWSCCVSVVCPLFLCTMANFGSDSFTFLNETHLVESSRFTEIQSSENYVTFVLKDYSIDKKKSTFNLFLHNSITLQTKQLTHYGRVGTGGAATGAPPSPPLSNPYLVLNIPGMENSIFYLMNGQIYSLPIDGGESIQISNFPLHVESFKICQGIGSKVWLLCVFSVYPHKSGSLQETIAYDQELALTGSSGLIFDTLMVRHWDTWNCYSKRNHVFKCPMVVGSEGSLEIQMDGLQDVMAGLETDCPAKPFGGAEEYSLSPDGRFVTLACRKWIPTSEGEGVTVHKQPKDMAWSTDIAVFLAPIEEATPTLRQISSASLASVHSSPTWSPDSKKVAFLSMSHPQYESDRLQLAVFDLETQELSYPTRDLDLSLSSLLWAPQEPHATSASAQYTLYATAQYRASLRLFRLVFNGDDDDNSSTPVPTQSFTLTSLSVIPGDESKSSPLLVTSSASSHSLYFLESSLLSPNILKAGKPQNLFSPFSLSSESAATVPTLYPPLASGFQTLLTSSPRYSQEIFVPCPEYFNGDLTLPRLSQFYFPAIGSDGQPCGPEELVHAWYLPPAAVRTEEQETALPKESTPLVLIIHGGPQGAFINSWNYRWNLSFYASRGYGVCAVNFHGSTGFGQTFCDSIRGDWGGQPYRDCVEAVRFLLSQKPYLNPKRVGAMGASYGGYMINWINGHNPPRNHGAEETSEESLLFRCFVNHDGIFDLKSLYYSTEELWFPEWEFGLPWDSNSGYERANPSLYVSQWRTPTLVIQGGKDHRVVETEGLSTFTALQRQGIESQFLYFPDENHWCLKPLNSLKWHRTVVAWLDRWLK